MHSFSLVQANIDRIRQWSEGMSLPLSECKQFVTHYGNNNPCHKYLCGLSEFYITNNFIDLGVQKSSDGQYQYHEHAANVAKEEQTISELYVACMQDIYTACHDVRITTVVAASQIRSEGHCVSIVQVHQAVNWRTKQNIIVSD
jgi:hypothetical protein